MRGVQGTTMLLRRAFIPVLLGIALLPWAVQVRAAETVDAATWGPYARLLDATQQSDLGYRVHWHWAEPNRKLTEDWINAYTGELSYQTNITPGAQPGQLVLESPKFGHKTWNGSIAADGSVLFVGVGMMKAPYRVRVDADGRMALSQVKLDGSQVTETFTTQYDHADAGGLIPRPNAKPADPKAWGVYARLLGARLAGKMFTSIAWSWMGEDAMLQDRGFLQPRLQIVPDGAGGLVMKTGKPGETWSGRIDPDGAVVWTSKKDDPFRVRIEGNEVVIEGVALRDGVVVRTKSDVRYRGHLPAVAPAAANVAVPGAVATH
jgi:hypothetical protein